LKSTPHPSPLPLEGEREGVRGPQRGELDNRTHSRYCQKFYEK
jgi:hypothetical protein